MTGQNDKTCWVPGVDRSHSVYRFTPEIYKFVQWYTVRERFGPGPVENRKHYDKKLDSSTSRTKRVVLEKALCNDWEWFCTFTISKDKHDRKDLANWNKKFMQFIRDMRKKGRKIRYLLVPEKHQDGSWHAHGFLSGLWPEDMITFKEMDKQGYRTANGRRLKRKLRDCGYYNWPAYQEKFGFCSLGRIKNPTAAGFYITKYISKDKEQMVQEVGLNSYYWSQGLNRAEKFVDFYGRDPMIDRLLVNKYDFCATGMTHLKDGIDWELKILDVTESAAYSDFSLFEPMDFGQSEKEISAPELEADSWYEMQDCIAGF